jgi:cysteine sulfinate desulfinase/cysteine desulfurase-like protein
MGLSEDEADATVRFSLGSTSTEADVQALSTVIADVVKKATL